MSTRLDKLKGKQPEEQKDIVDTLTSDDGDTPTNLGLRIPKREKERIEKLVRDINAQDQPFSKVTQTSVIIAAVQFFEMQRAKHGYDKLIRQL